MREFVTENQQGNYETRIRVNKVEPGDSLGIVYAIGWAKAC